MAYTSEEIEIKSLSVLKEKMDNTLSAAQDLRDALYGNRVDLKFNTVGGEEIPPRVVYRNQSYGVLPVPVKPGYEFLGWYRNMTINNGVYFYADPVESMSIVNVPKPNVTLFAKWEPAYIEFELDANGGTVEPSIISVRYLDRFAEAYQGPGKPTGLPYATHLYNSFEYWSSDIPRAETNYRGLNRVAPQTTNIYVSPRKLYANWRITDFYIYYDVNGGQGGDNLEPQKATNLAENTLSTVAQVKDKIRRDGFVLQGFTDVKGSATPKSKVLVDGKSVTVYAIWARERYRLNYVWPEGSLLEPTKESGNANPHDVLLDWIDYLNFVDETKLKNRLGKFFARWTTPATGSTSNPWVANLLPEDGDILWNYNMGPRGSTVPKGETTLIPADKGQIPNSVLVSVGYTANPLSNTSIKLKHGDSLSTYQYGSNHFVLSALISSTTSPGSTSTLTGLSGEEIRLYPRQAKYLKPVGSSKLSNSFVAVSFAYNTVMEGVKVPVTVDKSITRIELIDPPDKTVYMNGDTVDTTGLRVRVIYSDGVEEEEIYFDNNVMSKGVVSCSMDIDRQWTQVSRRYPNLHVSATYDNKTKVLPAIAFTVNLSSNPILLWDALDNQNPPHKMTLTNSHGETLSVFTGKTENIPEGIFRAAYEPEGEPVKTDEFNLVENLIVYAYYPDEDDTLCPVGWNRKDRVYDYYFDPLEISEKIMKSWPYKSSASLTADNKTGRIAYLSVYWRAWYQNNVVSTLVPLSVYEPFGIGSLTLAESIELSDVNWSKLSNLNNAAKLKNIRYNADKVFDDNYGTLRLSGIIVRIPREDELNSAGWTDPTQDPIFGGWKLTGTYNRPNAGSVEVRLSDCNINPSVIDLATSAVTATFDYASVKVLLRPTLPGSCYCGFFEVDPITIRERPDNASPVFLPQSFTPEDAGLTSEDTLYYYNYLGTKYLRYYVVADDGSSVNSGKDKNRNIIQVTRRSDADAQNIIMSDYKRIIHTTSNPHTRISLYYTDPDSVKQWNAPLTRKNCRETSSFITRIDIAPPHWNWGTYEFDGKTYNCERGYYKDLLGVVDKSRVEPISNRNIGNGTPGYEEDTFQRYTAVGGLKRLSAMRYVCHYQTMLKNFYIKNPMNLRHAEIGAWWSSHPNYCDHPLNTKIGTTTNSTYICCYADTEKRSIARTKWPYFRNDVGKSFKELSGVSPVFEPNFYMVEIGRKCFTSCINLAGGFLFDGNEDVVERRKKAASDDKVNISSIYFIPASVRRIGYAAFANCKNMKEFLLQNGNDTLETYDYRDYNVTPFHVNGKTFKGKPLTSDLEGTGRSIISSYRFGATIHRLSSIDHRVFYNCVNLKKIDEAIFGRYVKSYGTGTGNEKISSSVLTMGNRFLSTIREMDFFNCDSLVSIRLGEISHISSQAFYGCKSLTKVTWPQRIEMYVSCNYEYSNNPSLNYKYDPGTPGHYLRNLQKMSTSGTFGIGANDDEKKVTMDIYRKTSMSSYFERDKVLEKVMANRDVAPKLNNTWKVINDTTYDIIFKKHTTDAGAKSVTGKMDAITNKFRAYEYVTLPKCQFKLKGKTFAGWKFSMSPDGIRVKGQSGKHSGVLPDKSEITVTRATGDRVTVYLSATWK